MDIRSRNGGAFVLAMVFVLASLLTAALFHNYIRTILKVSESASFLDGRTDSLHVGLARGLSLLETGLPPDGYTCRVSSPQAALVFAQNGPDWNIISSTEEFRITEATCSCPSDFNDSNMLWANCAP